MTVDPVGGNPARPQSWNRFAYVLDNPLKYIDPFGLFPCPGLPGVECDEEITVIGEAPSFNPFTGVQGARDLVRIGALIRNLDSVKGGFAPLVDAGLSVRQIAALAGPGSCTGPNCQILQTVADDFNSDPILQTIEAVSELEVGILAAGFVAETGLVAAVGEIGTGVGTRTTGAGAALTKRLFGKGGLLNSNRFLRIGFGRKGGQRVFRVAGRVVQKLTGRSHIDLGGGGPL